MTVIPSTSPASNEAGFELVERALSPAKASAFRALGLDIVEGRRDGVRIWDLDGNEYLARILPRDLAYSSFTPGGGEAVEVACQRRDGSCGHRGRGGRVHGQVGFARSELGARVVQPVVDKVTAPGFLQHVREMGERFGRTFDALHVAPSGCDHGAP